MLAIRLNQVPYTAKHLKGKTFTVWVENWKTFTTEANTQILSQRITD